ncbi:MAG: preprotein translocase subunit SecA, partial [Planctomycetota bacterium]
NQHYLERSSGYIGLTDEGIRKVHSQEIPIPVEQLLRPWTKYVEAALRAQIQLVRDVHYIVLEGKIRIVEQSTGRIFEDRSWQAGLHQAVEAQENLEITPESLPLARITRQRFFRKYSHLSGMTGTAAACAIELNSIYGLRVQSIPLRIPSKRQEWPPQTYPKAEEKWAAIVESVSILHQLGRPILIGTRTILESQTLAQSLLARGIRFELLNGKQDASEAEIVARAGERGAVTIATNLAGRGTDIKLSKDSYALGGLHVIVSECHSSARIDRQLIGRCARQGDPGSCQTFVAADDWLFRTHAPDFCESLRWIAESGNQSVDIAAKIQRIQKRIEREQYLNRLQFLDSSDRQDRAILGL